MHSGPVQTRLYRVVRTTSTECIILLDDVDASDGSKSSSDENDITEKGICLDV